MTQINPADENPLPEDDIPVADTAAPTVVAELEKKIAETNDKMLRALAEAENTRRRTEKERQDTAKFAVSTFARDLLMVVDNLRRALNVITPEMLERNPDLKNIAVGVEATERELLRVFENNGIKKIDPLNQPFNPNFHEVLFESASPDKPPGTVIQVIEPGYTIHERLLRPARVGIAQGAGTTGGNQIDEQV